MSGQPESDRPIGAAGRLLQLLGGIALLVCMGTDALAVLGRHTGFAINGAIEIFQVFAVIALSSSILLTTMVDRHAAVDLLMGRLARPWQRRIVIFGRLAVSLAFAALAAGSIWLSADLWPTHEITEQLALPVAGFRLFWLVCCGAASLWSAMLLVQEFRA